MTFSKKGQWLRSGDGYFTLDKTTSDLAIQVAREPKTTVEDRATYARSLNSSANTAFQTSRDSRKLKAG